VAGGVALVLAGGGAVREYDGARWSPFQLFGSPQRDTEQTDVRFWRRELLIGTPGAVARMSGEGQESHEPDRF
jgi:hypothetical protein